MNNNGWIGMATAIALALLGAFATELLRTRLGFLVLERFGPLVGWLLSMFRLEAWLFEPIEDQDLPAKQRRFFESHTGSFIARGFTPLGTFVLRRDPQPSCSRYFLSPDETVIGGLTCYLGGQTIECMSVLLDGMYLETANICCNQLPPKEHGLQFFTIRTDDAMELIEHHLACVAKLSQERGTQPAPLEASDLIGVCNYGRELSLKSLGRQGYLGKLPEFLTRRGTAAGAAVREA